MQCIKDCDTGRCEKSVVSESPARQKPKQYLQMTPARAAIIIQRAWRALDDARRDDYYNFQAELMETFYIECYTPYQHY